MARVHKFRPKILPYRILHISAQQAKPNIATIFSNSEFEKPPGLGSGSWHPKLRDNILKA
jgi:hypothetical protein